MPRPVYRRGQPRDASTTLMTYPVLVHGNNALKTKRTRPQNQVCYERSPHTNLTKAIVTACVCVQHGASLTQECPRAAQHNRFVNAGAASLPSTVPIRMLHKVVPQLRPRCGRICRGQGKSQGNSQAHSSGCGARRAVAQGARAWVRCCVARGRAEGRRRYKRGAGRGDGRFTAGDAGEAVVIRAARHAIALGASLHVNRTQATPPYPRECASSLTHLPSIEHQSRQRLLGLQVGEAHDETTRQRGALDVVAKFENVTYCLEQLVDWGQQRRRPLGTPTLPARTPTVPAAARKCQALNEAQ